MPNLHYRFNKIAEKYHWRDDVKIDILLDFIHSLSDDNPNSEENFFEFVASLEELEDNYEQDYADWPVQLPKYFENSSFSEDKRKKYCKFVYDMINAGLEEELRHYNGRFYYEGPAVVVDAIDIAMSQTSVKCQYDGMGLGYVVYPK